MGAEDGRGDRVRAGARVRRQPFRHRAGAGGRRLQHEVTAAACGWFCGAGSAGRSWGFPPRLFLRCFYSFSPRRLPRSGRRARAGPAAPQRCCRRPFPWWQLLPAPRGGRGWPGRSPPCAPFSGQGAPERVAAAGAG